VRTTLPAGPVTDGWNFGWADLSGQGIPWVAPRSSSLMLIGPLCVRPSVRYMLGWWLVAATLPPAAVEGWQHLQAEVDQARQEQAEEDRGQ
jgi:hypothetical protein